MKKLLLLTTLLLSCILANATEKIKLFDTANSSIPYRIPAIAETADGRLIAINSYLVCGTDPGFGQVDLHCKWSTDQGKTWTTTPQAIAEGYGDCNKDCNAYGDAAVVADRENKNEILVLCVTGCTVYWMQTTTRQNPNRIAEVRSTDGGKTWEVKEITEEIYSLFDGVDENIVQSMFVGSGKIHQSRFIKKGSNYRLYAALCARPNGNRVIYSDDFGKTWHALGGASARPCPQGDEPKCEELPDGRVLLSSRNAYGGGRWYNIFTYSDTNKENGTWDAAAMSQGENNGIDIGNNTNGEILIFPATRNADKKQVYLCLQSVPYSKARWERKNVSIYYKALETPSDYVSPKVFAASWEGRYQVSDTTSAYSTMILQSNHTIGFFYEENYHHIGEKPNPFNEKTHNVDGYDGIYTNLSIEEITDGKYSFRTAPDQESAVVLVNGWEKLEKKLYYSWTSRDTHLLKDEVPQNGQKKELTVYAWKGERANCEAVLYSPVSQGKLSVEVNNKWADARFVDYVITDKFQSCGFHPTSGYPYYFAPDIIDQKGPHEVAAMDVRPVWVTLEIPYTAKAGKYNTKLLIKDTETGKVKATLALNIVVLNKTLPTPDKQKFHLDFWQQPYSVSRYYHLKNWSKEHFDALRPYYNMLARAGQKVATTILFYEPWGRQSNDKFEPMVDTRLAKDSTWKFDYTVFDKYVEFCEECGIKDQINCYSMIPWDMKFRYFDEGSQRFVTTEVLKTTDAKYQEMWKAFLTAFAKHLKEKGWFQKTCLAMDERDPQEMQNAIALAHSVDPGFKIALAGTYNKALISSLADYCISYGEKFTPEDLRARRAKGYISTNYTCCTEKSPNIFTNSQPAEAAFIPLHCAANDVDGYLHWSWMNWTDDPLHDSRFFLFSPGDTYVVYPDNCSSIRFERFIEGIEQFEKIQILKKEGNKKKLAKLNEALKYCKDGVTPERSAGETVSRIEAILNE